MKKQLLLIIICCLSITTTAFAQDCTFTANGNQYTVNITITGTSDLNETQGPTCNVTNNISYTIDFTGPNPPPNFFFFNGNIQCPGDTGFQLGPVGEGSGTATSNNTFSNTPCTGLDENCPLTVSFSAPNIAVNNGDCGFFRISNTTLPVELVSFTGDLNNNNEVVLKWVTASEENNEGFEIQQSFDGQNWDEIAFVAGNGTTSQQQNYQYVLPYNNQRLYFRLKQIDIGGAEENFSSIVLITPEQLTKSVLYPNPVKDQFTLESAETSINWSLTSITGQVVRTGTSTTNVWTEDISELASGIYILQLRSGKKVETLKLVKQ